MKRIAFLLLLLALSACGRPAAESSYEPVRPRTIITTDGECDDYDSFIRVLLYSNDLDIQGIVYSASQWHWAGDGKGTLLLPENQVAREIPNPFQREPRPQESMRWIGTQWVQDLIDAYAKCWPNLVRHDARYPSPEYLQGIVKVGNIRVEGDMAQPTEGSDFIKDLLLDDVPGLLHAQIWGGTNTVARALLSIEEEYKDTPAWDEIYRKVSDKLVIYIIQGQDGTWENYISVAWPEVRTVYNGGLFGCFAYMWRSTVPDSYKASLGGDWFREHILEGHGPLAAAYLTLGSGYDIGDPADRYGDPEMVGRTPGAKMNDFISEGDSPSFFTLFDFFGLRSLEHPEWGTMGGRYNREGEKKVWREPQLEGGFNPFARPREDERAKPKESLNRATGDYNPFKEDVDMFYSQTRWVEALQQDFAARADWCVRGVDEANHAPVLSVRGSLDLVAKPGAKVRLAGRASDPDGDPVTLSWWQYREAGTGDAALALDGADGPEVSFVIPSDVPAGSTFHLILQGTDHGTPALTRYQRVIVTVE